MGCWSGTSVTEHTWDYKIKDYFVHNPTTGEYKPISIRNGLWEIDWMYLAFDPSNSPHYNIVCVLSSYWYTKPKFAVYSSKTCSWKEYHYRFNSKLNFEKGVFWNGSIHWISLSKTENSIYFNPGDPDHDHDDNENVVVDDVNDSCYIFYDDDLTVSVMPTPPILGEESYNYFGESCDHLNFISYYGRDEYKLKVYEMRRDYSEWFVKYSVDVSNVVRCRVWNEGLGSFGCRSLFAVCGLVRGKKGDNDDSFLVLLVKRKMVEYNVVTGTFEIVGEFDEDEEEDEEEEEEEGEEYNERFDKFYMLRLFFKHYCPLQYIESLCLV